MRMRRIDVEQWCEANQVSLSVEHWSHGTTHVHANIDKPKSIFKKHGTHNLGLWDGGKPDWGYIYKDLIAADLGECTDPNCECCEND